jgi:hypothetical protein
VARGSEVQVKRCISFGCVVELFTGSHSGIGTLDLRPVASRYIDCIHALVREGTAHWTTVKNFLEALITSIVPFASNSPEDFTGEWVAFLHRIWDITGSSLILEQAVLTSFGYFSPFSPGIW